jgi:hypothetical protein
VEKPGNFFYEINGSKNYTLRGKQMPTISKPNLSGLDFIIISYFQI